MRKEFPLNFDRKHFEDIYFREHNGNYLFSSVIRNRFRLLVVGTVVFAGIVIGSQFYEVLQPTLGMGSVVYALFVAGYLAKVNVIRKWKKSIATYLDELEQQPSLKVVLADDGIGMNKNGQDFIESWKSFHHVDSQKEYLHLTGTANLLLPAKSIRDNDFKEVKRIVKNRVNTD